MPQLDQFTYLTQFVWLCVFYMTFYVLLFNDGLPKISRILKLRAHLARSAPRSTEKRGAPLLQQQPEGAKASKSVVAEVSAGGENQDIVFRTLNSSISYLYSSVSGASSWCTKSVDSLNANQLKLMNKSYLRSIGEISLSQLIKYSALEASAPVFYRTRLRAMFLPLRANVWALRVQKCLLSGINKKKKKK
jgi:F-type H+-transporting ATPase subunit b